MCYPIRVYFFPISCIDGFQNPLSAKHVANLFVLLFYLNTFLLRLNCYENKIVFPGYHGTTE